MSNVGMQLNLGKCVVLSISNKKGVVGTTYTLRNNTVKEVHKVRWFRTTATSNIKLTAHIDNVAGSPLNPLGLVTPKIFSSP